MTKIPEDSNPPNSILEYPGYYLPPFFSTMLGELPNFELPDWGPIPPLLQEHPVTPPRPSNPDRTPPIEVDPPIRPPQWLFGPPRFVLSTAPEPRAGGLPGMIETYLRSRNAGTIGGEPAVGAPSQGVSRERGPARNLRSPGIRPMPQVAFPLEALLSADRAGALSDWASVGSRRLVAQAPSASAMQPPQASMADLIMDYIGRQKRQNASQALSSVFDTGAAPVRDDVS